MRRIAILSDTHGLLREEVRAALAGVDCVFHAGDVGGPDIAQELRRYGELYLVRGNNDREWAENLPETLEVTIEGVRFFMIHNRKMAPPNLTGVTVALFGHTHRFYSETEQGILWLNPGSCGKRRFDLGLSLCLATADNGVFRYERVELNVFK